MKRYWKVISLCILSVLILGGFYIQSGIAAKEDIKVVFNRGSGDEAELENLIFHGGYEIGNRYQSLQISNKETVDLSSMSLLQSLRRVHSIPAYKNLVEEYKSFMRGKNASPNSFYEDNDVIAYAEIQHESGRKSSFEIDVLNKKSGERTSFKLDTPDKGKYNWITVDEVQDVDGKLKVFARGFQEIGTTDLILYTVDIQQQKLEKTDVILSTLKSENILYDIRIINDNYQSIKSQRYMFFYIETQEILTSMEKGTTPILGDTEAFVYDIEKDETQKMMIPAEMNGMLHSASIHDSILYIPTQIESGYEIVPYDLEKQVFGEKIEFGVTIPKEENSSQPYMKLMNGKFYVVSDLENGPTLLISDVITGKVLYEGVIAVKKDGLNLADYSLHIHDLESIQ